MTELSAARERDVRALTALRERGMAADNAADASAMADLLAEDIVIRAGSRMSEESSEYVERSTSHVERRFIRI